MAQQTAVEWLVEKLAKKHNEFQALAFYYDHKDEIEQAKEMEKMEIWDAYCDGRWSIAEMSTKTADRYYNDKFKK
jgi:hypothetical protein